RNFKKVIDTGDKAKVEELSRKLIKSFDKAAQKNVIHKNASARKKSRIMKKVNQSKK
ncbi:30S ribosomal protein S20, partial [Patescibacteria group bacterium]|nr:30S ribosomal protein S20 [Patescibacteria group bacterium]